MMNRRFGQALIPCGWMIFALAAALSILCAPLLAIQSAAVPADVSPPVLDLIDSEGRALHNGTVFDSGDINITCLAMDEISEIESVGYSIDGSSFEPTETSGDMHRTSIILSGLTAGGHSITVRATNNASLTTEKRIEFTVDVSAASSDNLLAWNILGAMVAISGITIALILIVRESRKVPRHVVTSLREGEMPPIL